MSDDPHSADKAESPAQPAPVRLREPIAAPPEARAEPAARAGDAPSGWEDIFEPGEELLWQGQPIPGTDWGDLLTDSARSAFIPLIIGTAWTALVLVMVEPFWAKLIMAPFGLPFIWSGYALTFGKVLTTARALNETWYTVSSRALYIASVSKEQRKLERFALSDLPFEPQLIDGSPGTIWFAERDTGITHRTSYSRNAQHHRSIRQVRDLVGFRRLESPREVYGIITKARAKLRAAAPEA